MHHTSHVTRDKQQYHRDYNREWRRKRKEQGICHCGRESNGRWRCSECQEKWNAYHRVYYRKLKEEVLAYYGHTCACCGETRYEFLTLDHINEDGAEQRRQAKTRGGVTYFRQVKQTWPDDLQVLCWNCNLAKHHHGRCPHVSM